MAHERLISHWEAADLFGVSRSFVAKIKFANQFRENGVFTGRYTTISRLRTWFTEHPDFVPGVVAREKGCKGRQPKKVLPDTRVRVFEERRASGKMDDPITATEMSWLVTPPTVGDQRLRFYAMLLEVGAFAATAADVESGEMTIVVRRPRTEVPVSQNIVLMNGKQLQSIGFGSTLLRGIKEASRLFGDSPFVAKRYSTPERLMAWLEKHPDFTPSRFIDLKRRPGIYHEYFGVDHREAKYLATLPGGIEANLPPYIGRQ